MYKVKNIGYYIFIVTSVLAGTLLSATSYSQSSDVDFVIEKIRKDYFPLKIDYDSLKFEKYVALKKQKSVGDTFRFISEITNYFKDQHLICYQRKTSSLPDYFLPNSPPEEILRRVEAGISSKDKSTGYWINDLGTEIIGIIKNDKEGLYHGYVVQSEESGKIGKLVLKFSQHSSSDRLCEFVNTYFQYRQYAPIKRLSLNEFQIWSYMRWKRVTCKLEKEIKIVRPFNYKASAYLLDSGVIVFRIPENSPENIQVVDSLVMEYKNQLETARILLIDIRNNPGGTIRTYSKLLPYVYTNEIVRPDGHTFVSNDLLQYEIRNLEGLDPSQSKDEYEKQLHYIDSLRSVLGQRVFYKGKNKKFEIVLRKPEKVGLLVNYACMSAAEAMVLDMQQSTKVVVFGENTAGAIDNTNTFVIKTPSGKYSMWMPSFRGVSTSLHKHYAGKGIPPDVRIKNIEQDWIKIAIKYLESH